MSEHVFWIVLSEMIPASGANAETLWILSSWWLTYLSLACLRGATIETLSFLLKVGESNCDTVGFKTVSASMAS